jgi:pyridoxine/pyridoxamine 5'-phosphate oxidase
MNIFLSRRVFCRILLLPLLVFFDRKPSAAAIGQFRQLRVNSIDLFKFNANLSRTPVTILACENIWPGLWGGCAVSCKEARFWRGFETRDSKRSDTDRTLKATASTSIKCQRSL